MDLLGAISSNRTKPEMATIMLNAQAGLSLAEWLNKFEGALQSGVPESVASLFSPDGLWRDFSAFTWDLQTLEGRDSIAAMVGAVEGIS